MNHKTLGKWVFPNFKNRDLLSLENSAVEFVEVSQGGSRKMREASRLKEKGHIFSKL